jgi:uncharacterized membrane protein
MSDAGSAPPPEGKAEGDREHLIADEPTAAHVLPPMRSAPPATADASSGGEALMSPRAQAAFDAAAERARATTTLTPMWLSHHQPDAYGRCIRVGRRHVCRRCGVLYPVAFAVVGLALLGARLSNVGEIVAFVVLPLPAVVELLAEQLGRRPYNPRRQVLVTIPLGVGLGVGFTRYLADITDPVFWGVVIVYGGVCLAAVVWRWRQ